MDKVDKRFADKIGEEYKLFPLAAPHYEELQHKLAELTTQYTLPNPTILEIGCGTGLTTAELYKARPDAKIIALDAEEIMVEQAKISLSNTGVEVVCSDALEYLKKLNDRSLDIVVSAFCLHNTPPEYRLEIFKEIGRVLKPEGMVINGDKIAQDDPGEHQKTLKNQIEAFAAFQNTPHPELQEEWTKHYLQDDKIKLTEQEQRELFELAGCKDVKMHNRWMMDALFSAVKE